MDIGKAYDIWSGQYDTNLNKTRDLEALAIRKTLENIQFDKCLEIGCGTGKNTEWLLTKAKQITAVDISEKMAAIAKAKINSDKIEFLIADINKEWGFIKQKYNLVTFSLILEHIENLDNIFNEASKALVRGGYLYIGELHPFKQYSGSKARFENEEGIKVLECFPHNISDFINSAKEYDLELQVLEEFFDSNDRSTIPRILVLLFKKL